ncbi:meiotically up-regulated gene 113-domain-containing protein [Lipomyces oligophaga]|uniref:meiotically up-regulated gene 113-domain-containing protein n=1 Tax=Lipomyces oligophaga TaxID=45792 RepID=UPI0034CFC876
MQSPKLISAQCCGITRAGHQCRRIVRTETHRASEPRYCHLHVRTPGVKQDSAQVTLVRTYPAHKKVRGQTHAGLTISTEPTAKLSYGLDHGRQPNKTSKRSKSTSEVIAKIARRFASMFRTCLRQHHDNENSKYKVQAQPDGWMPEKGCPSQKEGAEKSVRNRQPVTKDSEKQEIRHPHDYTRQLAEEVKKPLSKADEPGYIYVYEYAQQHEQRAAAGSKLPARSSLRDTRPDLVWKRAGSRAGDTMLEYNRRRTGDRVVLMKVGRTNDVGRRLGEWNSQCSREIVLRWCFPRAQDNQLCRAAHRAERLIHLELRSRFGSRLPTNGFFCSGCGHNHLEWFAIHESELAEVVETIWRWVAYVGVEPGQAM